MQGKKKREQVMPLSGSLHSWKVFQKLFWLEAQFPENASLGCRRS
jgi:hypothetical protein